jgi:hypothetical protein
MTFSWPASRSLTPAFQAAGRGPGEGKVEATTAAMRMGVEAISELARS